MVQPLFHNSLNINSHKSWCVICKGRNTMKYNQSNVPGMSLGSAIALVIAALGLSLSTSCRQKGPAEKAGEKVDKAIENTGDAIKDATN